MRESNSSAEIIRVCRVRFRPEGPVRNFLAGDLELSADDYVYVPVGTDGQPKMAKVLSVDEWTEQTIPYSPEGLQKVLRKVDPVIAENYRKNRGKGPFWMIVAILLIVILAGAFLYAIIKPAPKYQTYPDIQHSQQSGKTASPATPKPVKTPVPTATPKSVKKKSSSKTDDPYDAASYKHPEDFYEAYRDDFWDYEDAEEYWESHN